MANIKEKLKKMDVNQLRTLSNLVKDELADKLRVETERLKRELKNGDLVKVDHERLKDVKCTVTDVRRTKATIKTENGLSYTVPISLLMEYK